MPKWLKWTLTAVVFIGLTIGLIILTSNDGVKECIKAAIASVGWFGYILYILIQIIVTTAFCFAPGTTFMFGCIAGQIFTLPVGLILSIIGCWISSMIMFLIGRYGGEKLIDWLVGKEDRIKAQNLISDRATVLVPVMLACPFFPDDALCMVSGMTKMNFWYFSVMSLITRSIGVSVTVVLVNKGMIDPNDDQALLHKFISVMGNNPVLWIMLVNLIILDVYAVWKLSSKVEQILKRRRGENNEEHTIDRK